MRKKKYGEDTVVIRVPVSQKEVVLKFIERFEVLGNLKTLDSSNPLHGAYFQGYLDCYEQWQDYNYSLMLVLTGNEHIVPLYLDLVRGRIPKSAHAISLKQVTDVFLKSNRKLSKIESQIEILEKYLDDSWLKVSDLAKEFSVKQLNSAALEKDIKNECNV